MPTIPVAYMLGFALFIGFKVTRVGNVYKDAKHILSKNPTLRFGVSFDQDLSAMKVFKLYATPQL
jgi:hypothetical protein